MTLRNAIIRDVVDTLHNQLLESASEFEFDLDREYPDNLKILDSEEWNEDKKKGYDEYLEDKIGVQYFISYSIV